MVEQVLDIIEQQVLHRKEKLILVLLGILAGIIFNYFFYNQMPGLSVPLFVAFLLGIFWWTAREKIILNKTFGWFLVIPIVLLSSTFAIYSNPVLLIINSLMIPFLLAAHTVLVTGISLNWWIPRIAADIMKQAVPMTIKNIPQSFLIIVEQFKTKKPTDSASKGKQVFTGLVISVPILLVVIPLLSSADLIFSHYLRNITEIGLLIDYRSSLNQGMIILCVSVYVTSYLLSFHSNRSIEAENNRTTTFFSWDPTTIITVLSVINLVYLLFSVIQFSYLYGNSQGSLPDGFTYAEYARRGFFELVAVTLINLGILLSSMKFIKKENTALFTVFQVLVSLLVVFSINMLFSAHYKMSLYEQAYGLTYLRVFVHYFMGMLFIYYLIALSNIWLKKPSVLKTYIVAALVFYTVLNFVNVDRMIAQYNITMYTKNNTIDVHYLQRLSYDAIPEIAFMLKNNNTESVYPLRDYLITLRSELPKNQRWHSFNYSQSRARLALNTLKNI